MLYLFACLSINAIEVYFWYLYILDLLLSIQVAYCGDEVGGR